MPDLSYQLVTGRWSYVVADGIRKTTDPDAHPDEVLPGGVVVFTPEIGNNPDLPTGSPSRSVALGVITGLVADGVLQDLDGRDGIELVTRVGTRPVYWTAKPALTFGNRAIASRTYTFGPTVSGGTIHLNDTVDPGDYPDLSDELMLELLAKYSKPAGGIPESDLAPAVRDKLGAKSDEFFHSMAGATSGMPLPAVSNSGHPLTWTRLPAGVGSTGKINGRGGFWTDPASAPSAVYMTATLKAKPRWGWVRGAFLPQSTPTGTVCLAVPSKATIAGALTMALHFRSTLTTWAITLWDNGGEQLIDQGLYSPPIVGDPNRPYEIDISFRHVDDDTIQCRLADGTVVEYSDPRFANLGGAYLFAESYDPLATDAVVAIMDVRGGDTPPSWLFTSPSAGDMLQQLAYRPRTVNGQGPDANGNINVSVGTTIPDGSLATAKYADDSVTSPKLAPSVRTSLGKADTAVQAVGGVIPQALMPAVAVTDFLGAVGSQAAMLLLSGQRGDWCTRTDLGTDWQLIAEPSSTLASWRERTYPASPVSSVAGRTGAVTISTADITDSTAVGRTVVKATDQAAARSAIGAGTSSLTLGTTGSTAAAGNDTRLSDTRTPTAGTVPADISMIVAGKATTRAVGTLDNPFGVKLQRALIVTAVTVRGLTADASGSTVVELRQNGATVTGTAVTLPAANQVAGVTVAGGPWAFNAGDVLTAQVTAVGTTPGLGLVIDVKAVA